MKSKREKKERLYFYIFISPWIIGFLVFQLFPILTTLFLSFFQLDKIRLDEITNVIRFVGFKNYTDLFKTDLFWHSVKATLYYSLISVPLQLFLSLGLALLINQKVPFRRFFRTAMYLPSMVSSVIMCLLWMWIFNPDLGLVNSLLKFIGIKGPLWLYDENWAIPALIIMSLWAMGGGMIVFLAALQGVPESLKEASSLDGANRWQQFRNITFPMISPIFLFQLIIGIIDSFQVFTQAAIMTRNGGPNYATYFYVYYIYVNAFKNHSFGYSAAMSWLLLLFVLVLTFIILKISDKLVYYEGGQNNA